MVFRPHGWIRAEQVVEFIDHCACGNGKKVKVLTFREAFARLEKTFGVRRAPEQGLGMARRTLAAAASFAACKGRGGRTGRTGRPQMIRDLTTMQSPDSL